MAHIYTVSTKQYFPSLCEIPEYPKKLSLRGELPKEKIQLLTVVGSRQYSDYGRRVCESLIKGLAGYPIGIVSGLAMGIDSIAHKTALSSNLYTIAVPGSGLDDRVLYPRLNYSLSQEIIQRGGLLLSEFSLDQKAAPWTFPKRNRIMAGISDAVLLVEAQEKSGTLITARLASDFNKELLVVPGSIFSETSKGTNQFLKLGAAPVTTADDILDALGIPIKTKAQELPRLTDKELLVVNLLRDKPLSKDEILKILKLSIEESFSILSILELKGLIKESLGKYHLN